MTSFETGNTLTDYPNGSRTTLPTWSGHTLDLAAPVAEEIFLDDIARGLSQHVRWGGQGDVWLSVAQHSLEVLWVLEEHGGHDIGVLRAALMHDAHEAYIGDLTGGLKYLLRGSDLPYIVRELDSAIEEAIGFQLRGFEDVERAIKEAEITLLKPEYELMHKNKKPNEVGMQASMCREMAMTMFLSEAERLGLRRCMEGSEDSAAGGS